jgi:hypothetical protein
MIRCLRRIAERRIFAFLAFDEVKTGPRVPLSHPFVERLIGTVRRECLVVLAVLLAVSTRPDGVTHSRGALPGSPCRRATPVGAATTGVRVDT